ncbi:hypothetical protein [Nannocystis punicea]|uniref:DUF4394 domain-containing protein n=1 Tax=Nannocystis punicea TaxID=2995304 RepID=A0ABY7GXN2_9BACT|nr:hypothetical protein [Nannocystis poenicansa]WAS91740.1 hypothetical protein O0S08_36625 [Nannocystis poenicansa]
MRRSVGMIGTSVILACSAPEGREVSATAPTTGDPPTGTSTTEAVTPTTTEPTGSSTHATTDDSGTSSSTSTTTTGSGPIFDLGGLPDMPPPPPLPLPQLWYSVEDLLVYIELNPADGTVAQLVTSTLLADPTIAGVVNSCALTMLEDGSLLGGRGIDGQTRLFHIPKPPTDGSDVEVVMLGDMPDGIYVEALHTDCDGRIYLMDTGLDSVSNTGNRLLRFTGDYLAGDLSYEVITDLMVAVAADIDDMAPGIDAQGAVTDNPGFGIDSGAIYNLDYTTGTGTMLGMGGTYGIHSLGGPLFDDGVSRLYVLSVDAEVFSADPVTLALSPVLATGPGLASGNPPGDTGFAGPLTACNTGFPQG